MGHFPTPPQQSSAEEIHAIEFRQASLARKANGLSALSFQLRMGETYAWLGGPGSGKTIIVDLILGFQRPDFGTIAVLGLDPSTEPAAVRRSISFVDGRGRLAGPMTP